jgi:hypothetical protein
MDGTVMNDTDETIDYESLVNRARELNAAPDPVPDLTTLFAGTDEPEGGTANAAALRTLKHMPVTVPDLSRFPAAIEIDDDGNRRFLPRVGDVVVHNLFASETILTGRPYLKTTKGRVQEVHDDGTVWLWDVERQHNCCLDWRTEDTANVRWPGARARDAEADLIAAAEVALGKGLIDEAEALLSKARRMGVRAETAGEDAVAKKKVGRPRRILTAEEQAKRDDYLKRKAAGTVTRGRPKGSKNRDAEVVAEEKKKLKAERKQRRDERERKKRQRAAR